MNLVINFVVAILLGALIGLQREHQQQKTGTEKFAGFRTFILISLLGAILGYISSSFGGYVLIITGFSGIILLSALSYIFSYLKYNDSSATTEVAALLTFLIGLMCVSGFLEVAVVLGVLIMAFLAFRENLHEFAKKIKNREILAVVKFALISLVILPILPNINYSLLDIPFLTTILFTIFPGSAIFAQLNVFNPYIIWWMVILVAGISFAGYILAKVLGAKKGFGITGLVGGLISSTAVMISMSAQSKKNKKIYRPFVIAVVLASATSFIRIIIEIAAVNPDLLSSVILPMGIVAISGYAIALFMYFSHDKSKKPKEVEFKQPFALIPAMKFGLFFLFILFISKLFQILFGSTGLYFAGILSGFADVDAITLSVATLTKAGTITNLVGVTTIFLAVCSNMLVKAGMAWFLGEKKFAKYIMVIFAVMLATGIVGLMFV